MKEEIEMKENLPCRNIFGAKIFICHFFMLIVMVDN